MTVMPLGRNQDCSLKNREPDVPAPWFLDPGGWSKTAAVSLYFIFPGICTLSLGGQKRVSDPLELELQIFYELPSTRTALHNTLDDQIVDDSTEINNTRKVPSKKRNSLPMFVTIRFLFLLSLTCAICMAIVGLAYQYHITG
ncbi:hypothetical protein STEG23_000398 [Scotinomys teguina]